MPLPLLTSSVGGYKTFDEVLRAVMVESIARFMPIKDTLHINDTIESINIMNGHYQTFYLETSELFDFLRDTEIKDVSAAIEAVEQQGTRINDDPTIGLGKNHEWQVGNTDSKRLAYLVHIPNKKSSIYFSITHTKNSEPFLFVKSYDDCYECPFSKLESVEYKDFGGGEVEKGYMLSRFILNLFLYISCFPECISESPPDGIIDPQNLKIKSKTIKVHESIIDRSEMTPHFRRGHFAHLTDERYKKSRGKYVFVRSTFVKGHAKTVLDSEEARETISNQDTEPKDDPA